MSEPWDVVIIGGGPAGLSTWLHLQALDPALAARTLLLEAATYPRDKPCGGGLTPLGDRLLEGLGIDLAIDAVTVNDVAFRVGDIEHHVRRPGAMRVVRRQEFDHALARIAVGRGLALHEAEPFVSVARDGAVLVVETGCGRHRTRALVGADGVRSRVRRAAGFPPGASIARLIKSVGDDARRGGSADHATFDFTSISSGLQGYTWVFPCRQDGRASLDVGVFDSRVWRSGPRADLRAALAGAMPDGTGAALRPTAAAVRWLAPGAAIAKPNVLLVGDAAGVDAALGEGIAQALDYGDLAANVLIDACARGDFSFRSVPDQLAAHPLGRALSGRHALARALYGARTASFGDLAALLATWLPAA